MGRSPPRTRWGSPARVPWSHRPGLPPAVPTVYQPLTGFGNFFFFLFFFSNLQPSSVITKKFSAQPAALHYENDFSQAPPPKTWWATSAPGDGGRCINTRCSLGACQLQAQVRARLWAAASEKEAPKAPLRGLRDGTDAEAERKTVAAHPQNGSPKEASGQRRRDPGSAPGPRAVPLPPAASQRPRAIRPCSALPAPWPCAVSVTGGLFFPLPLSAF